MPKRVWDDAIAKVHREGRCRVCKTTSQVQCAHTIGRSRQDVKDGSKVVVKADSIVPLCGPMANNCHGKYDARELDLLPYLGLWEQLAATEAAGGILAAYKRLTGGLP